MYTYTDTYRNVHGRTLMTVDACINFFFFFCVLHRHRNFNRTRVMLYIRVLCLYIYRHHVFGNVNLDEKVGKGFSFCLCSSSFDDDFYFFYPLEEPFFALRLFFFSVSLILMARVARPSLDDDHDRSKKFLRGNCESCNFDDRHMRWMKQRWSGEGENRRIFMVLETRVRCGKHVHAVYIFSFNRLQTNRLALD